MIRKECYLQARYHLVLSVQLREVLNFLTVPRRDFDDNTIEVELNFAGVTFTNASDGLHQRQNPNVLRLRLHVPGDHKEESPSRRLLNALETIHFQQKRNERIYADSVPIADLTSTPIIAIGEPFKPFRMKETQTEKEDKDIFIVVRKSSVAAI